jgi:predicted ATPase
MNLVERDAALLELQNAHQEAAAGNGRLVLISGEAGIGKSALVECFVREQPPNWRVLWGACDNLFTPRPLGPLHDMTGPETGQLTK